MYFHLILLLKYSIELLGTSKVFPALNKIIFTRYGKKGYLPDFINLIKP